MFNLARRIFPYVRNIALKNVTVVSARHMASKEPESDDDFDKRYEAYFNRSDIDGWEIRKAFNDLAGMDLIPEPYIMVAAFNACRRVNDIALAVRFLEVIKDKCDGAGKDYYPYIMGQIQPCLDELGIPTLEELCYDKPELAIENVFNIH